MVLETRVIAYVSPSIFTGEPLRTCFVDKTTVFDTKAIMMDEWNLDEKELDNSQWKYSWFKAQSY